MQIEVYLKIDTKWKNEPIGNVGSIITLLNQGFRDLLEQGGLEPRKIKGWMGGEEIEDPMAIQITTTTTTQDSRI